MERGYQGLPVRPKRPIFQHRNVYPVSDQSKIPIPAESSDGDPATVPE